MFKRLHRVRLSFFSLLAAALGVIFAVEYALHAYVATLSLRLVSTPAFHASLVSVLAAVVLYLWLRDILKKRTAEGSLLARTRQQEVLNRAIAVSLKDLTLDEILERTVRLLVENPWLDLEVMGGVWLVDQREHTLKLRASVGLPPSVSESCSTVAFGACLCGGAAESGDLVFTGPGGEERVCDSMERHGLDGHGHYCVPIKHDQEVLGVISLYLSRRHSGDVHETDLLRSVADVLSDTIIRKRMEARIEERLRTEEALARASSLFITEENADIDTVLGIMAEAVDANRAYVFILRDSCHRMDNTHEWCAPGTTPFRGRLMDFDTSRVPWWMRRLHEGRPICVPDVSELGAEAAAEREIFEEQSIKALLCVPIVSRDGRTTGFIGFDDTERVREWSELDTHLLKVVSGFIAAEFEREAADRTIRQMAYYDHLTGLPNRRLLFDRLEQVISRGRWKERLAAVLFLDLDRFKVINDTLGHELGDRLLRVVASRLRKCLHDGDTVARIGGDEFTVLLHEIGRPEDVFTVVKKIFATFEPPVVLGGHEVYMTASMGVSIYPHDGEHPDELLRNADVAMYKAKKEGRNTYCIYSPVMNDKALERLWMENMLRKAVDKNEFLLHFQPQVDVVSGRVVSVEALVRWDNPGSGLISPGDFIPIAEETGLIVPIGRWVLRNACSTARKLNDYGIEDIRVAVNISARQFNQSDFSETVEQALAETGLEPGRLELELTESIIMEHTEEVIAKMRSLRERGVRFSIDDFGTGYSSLSYLKRLPINTLKIDKSFVANILTSPDDASIAIAIIRLAHSLKLEVVAEGVETAEQFKFLKTLQCDTMQGFLFSRPLTDYQLMDMLKDGKGLDMASGG